MYYHTFIGKVIDQTSVKMFVFSDAELIRILPYFVNILNWLDYVENVRLIRAYNEFTNCIQMCYVTHRKEIAVFRHSRRTLFHLNETLLLLIVIIVYKHQFVYYVNVVVVIVIVAVVVIFVIDASHLEYRK